MTRRELEAKEISPFKHAIVHGERAYPVINVVKVNGRLGFTCKGGMGFHSRPDDVYTVEVIDDDNPDPVGPEAAQTVARKAAIPSWRLGRPLYRGRHNTVPPRST